MIEKTAEPLLGWTGKLDYIPQVALGGLALGAGGRLIKGLVDMFRQKGGRPRIEPAVSEVPVEVTPEEAEELKRKGIRVKRVLKSASVEKDASMLYGAGYGALGALTGAGGWALVDYFMDKAKKDKARRRVSSVRRRIEKLLSEEELPEDDMPVGAYMKAAEDEFFSKLAGVDEPMRKEAILNLTNLLGGLGLAVGAGSVLSALGSYKRMRGRNEASRRVGRLRKLLERRRATSPQIMMTPVVRVPEEEEEERELRRMLGEHAPVLGRSATANRIVTPAPAPSPSARPAAPRPAPKVVTPVVSSSTSGSPAQQAAANSGWQ